MALLKITVILAILSVTTSNVVYNVTPDDNREYECCPNLQHYLLNDTEYFTSNTQFHFLQGLHHLPTNLIIHNVSNISLIGSANNGEKPDTVIQCSSSVGFVMTNITNLTIKYMVIQNCKITHHSLQVAVFIKECSFVQIHSVHIYHTRHVISLLGVNILGNSSLHDITCFEMHFYYIETATKAKEHNISVNRYYTLNTFRGKYGIYLDMSQYSYKVTFKLLNTLIQKLKRSTFLHAISNNSAIQNTVFVINCQFTNNSYLTITYFFYSVNVSVYFNSCRFFYNMHFRVKEVVKITDGENVKIFHCSFDHNILLNGKNLINVMSISNTIIKHCYFYDNNVMVLHALYSTVLIHNVTFSTIKMPLHFTSSCIIDLIHTRVLFSGPVKFHKNKINYRSIITSSEESNITFHGFIEFFKNYACSLITYIMYEVMIIKVKDNTTVVINGNEIFMYFMKMSDLPIFKVISYQQCFFQYFSTKNLDNCIHAGNFSIIMKDNTFKSLSILTNFANLMMNYLKDANPYTFSNFYQIVLQYHMNIEITHCYWLPQSAFNTTIPADVNRQYIQYKNNSKSLRIRSKKKVCYCIDKNNFDCFKDELDPIYPGQTLTVSFYAHVQSTTLYTETITVIAETDMKQMHMHATPCIVINEKENTQYIGRNCTKFKYTISFPTNNWCELFLKTSHTPNNKYDLFYIRELSCPLGFVKIDGICQCYPSFKFFEFNDCNINTQTILRPSKGWISLDVHTQQNSSFSCYISQQCPFDYCKPYSFYINLSDPDTQCQFNRSGILCGQCQQGLSAVFSSSYCQHCSNIYLLLIIPMAMAGLAVVLLLFLLDLTVTDGVINGFILYANIISINGTMFFPDHHTITPLHMFVSFVNLDLGIKTCFYNGMDDYAKVWLQLAFPFYIISITLLIIIISKYSITVLRFTARRSISVLLTLFLLSFTKILGTTSSVLFSYSSITHLPNKRTTLVWSVDANVPLFSIKFTFLFIVCLFLFLMLLFFTAFTLCSKRILTFKIFNNLKPFSDSYQKPYKVYYWFGLQLLMRVIFFYIRIFDIQHKFIITCIILNITNGLRGMQKPFKKRLHSYHELLLMMNLLGLYIFILSEQWFVIYVLISLAGIHLSLIIVCRIMTHLCDRFTAKILSFCSWRLTL